MKDLIASMVGNPIKISIMALCIAFLVGVASPAFLEYLESQNVNILQEASARSIRNETEIIGVKERLERIDKKLDSIYLAIINKKTKE